MFGQPWWLVAAVLVIVAVLLWYFLRRVGATVSAGTLSGGADPGGRAGRSGGRDHAVRGAERSIRAAATDDRADGAHHRDDAHPFEGPRDDRGDDRANGFPVPDHLSLAHGVSLSVSFGLTIPLGNPLSFGLT